MEIECRAGLLVSSRLIVRCPWSKMEDVRARWGGGKKKKGSEGRWRDVAGIELKRMGGKGGKGRRATLARE
jgi:hypothetical protein